MQLAVLRDVRVARTARALLRYLITGGIAAVIDIEGFALLSWAQVPIVVGATCSFVSATIANFLLTARWVFAATPSRQKYLAFLAGAIFGLLANVALTYIGIAYVRLPPALAKTFAIAATFPLNFWINARIVFHRRQ